MKLILARLIKYRKRDLSAYRRSAHAGWVAAADTVVVVAAAEEQPEVVVVVEQLVHAAVELAAH